VLNDPRYTPVAASLPELLPPLTRAEAAKAAKRLIRKFGKYERVNGGEEGNPFTVSKRAVRVPSWSPRKCWVSPVPTKGHGRGWGRLIHDVSHHIFEIIHPDCRPHDDLHSAYETDIARYVAGTDWLAGGLLPKIKAPPSKEEKRLEKRAGLEQRLARWESKRRRADTAIRKLNRQLRSIK